MTIIPFPAADDHDAQIDAMLPPEEIDQVETYEDLRLGLIRMLTTIVAACDRAGPGGALSGPELNNFVSAGEDAAEAFARLIAAGADERILGFLMEDAS